jgi:hypothetical protein
MRFQDIAMGSADCVSVAHSSLELSLPTKV